MGEETITYSLKYQARVLKALNSEKLYSKWIVATNSLREENEVRILQYDPEQERLTSCNSYTHKAEVWDLATSGTSQEHFMTVWSSGGQYGASLWQGKENGTLVEKARLDAGQETPFRCVLWHPQQESLAVTIEEGKIHTWAVSNESVQATGHAAAGELVQLWGGALHPKQQDVAATVGSNNLQLWDLRSMSRTAEVVNAHRMPARDVCFAPANEHRLVTSGDDCKLKVWDTRQLSKGEALIELGGHSHWVWKAQYSPFYDQLIASSSSDSLVNLYYTPQLAGAGSASETAGSPAFSKAVATSTASRTGDLDGKAHTYDEHEDSVYGLAWSSVDPWLLASLSYDGRMVVNKVPKNVKYKVLI